MYYRTKIIMTAEEIKKIIHEATGSPCDVETNTINKEIEARTNCHYLDREDLETIDRRAAIIRIASEGGQITLYFNN